MDHLNRISALFGCNSFGVTVVIPNSGDPYYCVTIPSSMNQSDVDYLVEVLNRAVEWANRGIAQEAEQPTDNR